MKLTLSLIIFMVTLLSSLETDCSVVSRSFVPSQKKPRPTIALTYQQRVEKKIRDLEKKYESLEERYSEITAEFTRLADYQKKYGVFAHAEDKKRFDELISEGDQIYETKQKLNAQLEKLNVQLEKTKQGPGGFAFQEPENAPYRRLYQASAGGFLEMGMTKQKNIKAPRGKTQSRTGKASSRIA